MVLSPNLFDFIDTLGVLALLSVAYGVVLRRCPSRLPAQLALGALFGVGSIVAMLDPIRFADGVIVDLRHLPVAFAGAFVGLPAMLVALAMAAAARLAIGGLGVIPGIISITVAGIMGVVWARRVRRDRRIALSRLILLSAMISTNLAAALLLPHGLAFPFLKTFAPALVAFDLVATLTLGSFFERERKMVRREIELAHTADTDALTGLLNRRGFLRRMDALKVPAERGQAVLTLDLDHFKTINDTHGHEAGDVILEETGRRLAARLRGDDLLGRFGGEEFVVFLPAATRAEAEAVAERLRSAIAERLFALAGRELRVTISGGGCWTGPGAGFHTTLAAADRALCAAKAAGRNSVVFSSASLVAAVREAPRLAA